MATKSKTKSKSKAPSQAQVKQLSSLTKQAKSLGIKTDRSDAMLAQTKAEGGKAFKGSSFDKGQRDTVPVITSDSLKPTEVIKPMENPQVVDPGDLVGAGNTALASLFPDSLNKDASGKLVVPEKGSAEEAVMEAENKKASLMKTFFGMQQAPESQADIYAKEYKRQGIERAQKEVNQYANQLNAITAKAEAESLGLEGQGRGITESIIGGQQAQIRREAAIQALPIQAQLSAAQGNLEFAQQQLNTMFQLKVADSKAKTDFWNNQVDRVMQFANESQQNILNAKLADINQRGQRERDNFNLVNQWAQMAVETGQSNLITAFTALDPKSPTFSQDFGRLQAQVRKPVSVASTKRDTQVVDGRLIDMQTGEIITDLSSTNALGQDEVQKSLDQISFLKTTIEDSEKLVDATGPNMISQGLGNFFIGNTRVKQLANKLDTLKTNLLTLNSDPALKKFFGPQMTEKDTQLLMSAGSTLNAYSANEADNRAELIRYSDLLNRMETAIKQGQKAILPPVLQTGPDGVVYEIID